jgi:hypothetical protein
VTGALRFLAEQTIETASGAYETSYSLLDVFLLSPLSTGALHGRSQRVTIPGAVKYNFDLLKMSTVLLETCRGI